MIYRDFERADQFLLGIIESGQTDLVELYAPGVWEGGMSLLELDDEFSQRLGFLVLLLAVRRTPGMAAEEADDLVIELMNDELVEFIEEIQHRRQAAAADATPDPALDAKVRPLLAWLDM